MATLDVSAAIAILNHVRHGGNHDWYLRDAVIEPENGDPYTHLTIFEAVAIAEKYARDFPAKVAGSATTE